MSIQSDFQITDPTQPFDDAWQRLDTQLFDAAGNHGNMSDCRLCPKEAAWKLVAKLQRRDSARFDPSETWRVSGLIVPSRASTPIITEKKSVGGVSLDIYTIGGAGDVTYVETTTSHSNSSSSSGGRFGTREYQTEYRIECKSRNGTLRTTIKSGVPHLAVRISGAKHGEQCQLRATDDRGRPVNLHGPTRAHRSDLQVWFFQPAEGAKSIDATFIVQQPRVFEFYVKPPDVTELEKTEPAD